MKLISKFHDYYDTVLAQGRDESIVYVRERAEAMQHLSPALLPWLAEARGFSVGARTIFVRDQANHHGRGHTPWMGPDTDETETQWRFDEAFVVIAGKAHPVWVRHGAIEALMDRQNFMQSPVGDVATAPLAAAMRAKLHERRNVLQKEPDVQVRPHAEQEENTRAYENARARFLTQDFTELHIAQGAPVLLLGDPECLYGRAFNRAAFRTQGNEAATKNVLVVKNPRLASLGFQRTLDPFACFQEISQFIGGVVPGQQLPLVEISDKSKIEKKGFDPKYGFRTRPVRP